MARVEDRSPHLRRLTLAGPELAGLEPGEPAASLRLLVPDPDGLVLPTWNGNEFLRADGSRPGIRTLTPLRHDPDALELDVEVVIHGEGPLSEWAAAATPGAEAALSGIGRGYEIDYGCPAFVLAGDESAVPAISTLLPRLPAEADVVVHIEVTHPDARVDLPARAHATITWHDLDPGATPGAALVAAVTAAEVPGGACVWAAGEAASMQRIRTHLFDERGIDRARCTVRGYWKGS